MSYPISQWSEDKILVGNLIKQGRMVEARILLENIFLVSVPPVRDQVCGMLYVLEILNRNIDSGVTITINGTLHTFPAGTFLSLEQIVRLANVQVPAPTVTYQSDNTWVPFRSQHSMLVQEGLIFSVS